MAGDILKVYRALGGVKWLIGWAKANETEFVRQGLARLMPAFPKPEGDPDIQLNQQFNLDGNPNEIARRVAFVLAAGLQDQQEQVIEERQPYARLEPEEPAPPAPAPDPEREEWARQAAMTQEERLNSETLDEHTNRRAFAAPRPAWMDEPKPAGRPFVGVPRSKRDLL